MPHFNYGEVQGEPIREDQKLLIRETLLKEIREGIISEGFTDRVANLMGTFEDLFDEYFGEQKTIPELFRELFPTKNEENS
jgi:hypothetical protein